MGIGELREGFGRLQFLAGPMEYVRPFLGPLYAWAAIGPRYARPKLPVMIVLIMRYLAEELMDGHTMPCVCRQPSFLARPSFAAALCFLFLVERLTPLQI